jgi:dTDP-4-dehydrorhamnose reductase
MKILVLGAGGMAGHLIAAFLEENGHEISTVSARKSIFENTKFIDLTNTKEFFDYLENKHFDAIVNCVGILVKESDERKDLSCYLNSYLPHALEFKYRDTNTKIIHLSTDCVFSGENGPYTEETFPDGKLFYDRTKALGEIVNNKDLTFRMSIIGPDAYTSGTGLFNWFMSQSGEINGYTHALWNGVTTLELANAINTALDDDITGLYHLVSKENISKYELLQIFKEVFKRNHTTIKEDNKVAHDKTLVNTRTDFAFKVQNYNKMIKDMKEWIDSHPQYYKHYVKK